MKFLKKTIHIGLTAAVCAGSLLATEPTQELGIDEIVQLALKNHFFIQVNELEVERAKQAIDIEQRAFETNVSAQIERGQQDANETQSTDPTLVSGRPYRTSQRYSVDRNFSTGTTASVGLDSSSYDTDPELSASQVSLELRQNLLRGRGHRFNLAPIRIASKRYEIEKESLRQTVINTLAEAHNAYLDGILAEENLRVATESLLLSEQLLDENQKRAEAGSIATSDLLQTEAQVALRRTQKFNAQSTLVAAKNRLKRLLSKETGTPLLDWDFAFVRPPEPSMEAFDVKTAYAKALKLRPDYRQSIYGLDIGQINELREKNSVLPDVELYATMSMLGYGNSIEDSLEETWANEKPGYSVGIRFSRSLTNRANKAALIRAKLATNQLQLTLKQLEQAILLDIDSTVARIESDWKRHQSAQQGNLLAQKSLEAEQKRYQRGTSSTFVLIRLQSDLINARIRALVAANDYQKSIIELHRQTGEILDLHHISM